MGQVWPSLERVEFQKDKYNSDKDGSGSNGAIFILG
jgi:hypothetical protein